MQRSFRRLPPMAVAAARVALACLLAWACGSCAAAPGAEDPDGGALHALVAERVTGARLSATTVYRRCSLIAPPDGGTVPVTRCPARAGGRALSAHDGARLRQAVDAARGGADPAALQLVASIELAWADAAGNSADSAISHLQSAARLTERGAGPVLADLAAAFLLRAEQRQTPGDLVEAVEAAGRAVELAPRNLPARFNLALALDRLALDGEAMREWEGYLALDSASEWSDEARRRVRALAANAAAAADTVRPGPAAATPAVDEFVRQRPQDARVYGWDHVLGDWGTAVLEGQAARADSLLGLAARLGDALARRPGGDATLADAVRAIRPGRAGGGRALRDLARAHASYAAGQRFYTAGKGDSAAGPLRAALSLADGSPALARWAALSLGSVAAIRDCRVGEPALRAATETADTVRHTALAGRAWWSFGTTVLRCGGHDRGIAAVRRAAQLFARAGERANLGAVQFVEADGQLSAGNSAAGSAAAHRALMTLRPHRASAWAHGTLVIVGREAMANGLLRAAARLLEEDVTIAARTAQPKFDAEARLTRARIAVALGDSAAAAADVREASRAIARIPAADDRGWLEADLRVSEAVLSLSTAPARSAAALDAAAAYFEREHNPVRQMPALVARAEALLALDSVEAAAAALDRAIAVLTARRADITSVPHWALLLDATREVFDRIVMLRVAERRDRDALEYLECGRASLRHDPASRGDCGGAAGRARGRALAVPPGRVGVEYALVGDSLLAWAVAGETVELRTTAVDRDRLLRTVAAVRTALELQAAEVVIEPQLVSLYDLLVRPIADRLGPPGTPLVIVADGELADVPFDALRDTAGPERSYLFEVHPVATALSLRDVGDPRPSPARGVAAAAAGDAVLIVADPAFDRRAFPGLGRLGGAAAEAADVAASYPRRARVLAGDSADLPAFEAGLRRAAVVHFAGHALFDDARPERSVLVLAPPRDGGGGGGGAAAGADRATPADIARLDLRRVRLVVLSACETVRGRDGRAGGAAGLTGAFLAAGAGGVVGSLWRVDDGLTRDFMAAFHGAYRPGGAAAGDAPRALREARHALLRSADPRRRSPAAWGAFRYVGT